MKVCENYENCPYFEEVLPNSTALAEMYKNMYCLSNKGGCARYMVAVVLGKESVPIDLEPYMSHQAEEIIVRQTKMEDRQET
jgi:hypothetical protein